MKGEQSGLDLDGLGEAIVPHDEIGALHLLRRGGAARQSCFRRDRV